MFAGDSYCRFMALGLIEHLGGSNTFCDVADAPKGCREDTKYFDNHKCFKFRKQWCSAKETAFTLQSYQPPIQHSFCEGEFTTSPLTVTAIEVYEKEHLSKVVAPAVDYYKPKVLVGSFMRASWGGEDGLRTWIQHWCDLAKKSGSKLIWVGNHERCMHKVPTDYQDQTNILVNKRNSVAREVVEKNGFEFLDPVELNGLNEKAVCKDTEDGTHIGHASNMKKVQSLMKLGLLDGKTPVKARQIQQEAELESGSKVLAFINREISKDFPSMDDSSKPVNFAATTGNDPCKADMMLGFNEQNPQSGFGSKVFTFMSQLALAQYGKFSVAMWSPSAGKFDETWKSFFETSVPVCNHTDRSGMKYHGLEEDTRMFFKHLGTKDSEYVTKLKHAVHEKNYVYTPDTKQKIEETLKEVGLPEQYIGVHIRHGDKVTGGEGAGYISNEKYAEAIKKAIDLKAKEGQRIQTVWLATEDPTSAGVIQKALGSEYKIMRLQDTTIHKNRWKNDAKEKYYPESESMYNVLTDIEALRRAETFIGTATSNFGRLVYFLREPGSDSISLEHNWNYSK